MRFYIAWTDRDLCLQDHDSSCKVLVSPAHMKQSWTVRQWKRLPAELMLDSGSFQYMAKGRYPRPDEALARQLQLLDGVVFPTPVGLCHLDIPVLFGMPPVEQMRAGIRRSLDHARRLLELLELTPPAVPVEPIGVIQGYDADTVYDSGVALAEMGYRRFAIGSLIPLMRRHGYDDIRHMVAAAYEAVGSRLHVLGVTSPNLFDDFKRLRVESLDSSTPIREAVQGGVHYSRPYRRFRVPGVTPAAQDMLRSKRPGTMLDRPLECPCPVCRVDPYQLFQIGSKAAANHRSLHNYFHLKWEIEGLPEA